MEDSIRIDKINQYQGHNAAIYSLVDGGLGSPFFYSSGGDGWLVRWDKTGVQTDGLLVADTDAKVFAMHLDDLRQLMIIGDINGHVHWIDLTSRQILSRVVHHRSSVFGICTVGDALFTVSGDGYLCRWDIDRRLPSESIFVSHQGLRCICPNVDDGLLYIGSSDNSIYIIETSDLKVIDRIPNAHTNSVFSLARLGADYLISGGRDAHLKIRQIKDMQLAQDIDAHWYTINAIVHISSLKIIATASRDKTIRLWDATTFTLLKSIDIQKGGHLNSVNTLLWIDETQLLATASDDRMINMWRLSRIKV